MSKMMKNKIRKRINKIMKKLIMLKNISYNIDRHLLEQQNM